MAEDHAVTPEIREAVRAEVQAADALAAAQDAGDVAAAQVLTGEAEEAQAARDAVDPFHPHRG